MIKQSFLGEEDGRITLVEGGILLDTEEAAVLDVIDTPGRNMALLEEAQSETDSTRFRTVGLL